MWVVNNDEICTTASDTSTERNSVKGAASSRREIHHCGMVLGDPCREDLLTPIRQQNAANTRRNTLRQLFGICHNHDLRGRLMSEFPGRQANGGKQRFKVPRRKINKKPSGLAIDELHQLGGKIF